MRLAVMSDLHDNIAAWDLILLELNREKIDTLINCGDTVTFSTLRRMSENFNGQIHTVFGNNADRDYELQHRQDFFNVIHHGDVGGLELESIRIGFTHEPEPAMAMVREGIFDLVCHGHTHLKRWEPFDKLRVARGEKSTWILNPGTAGGVFQYPSFATVDLPAIKARFIDLRF